MGLASFEERSDSQEPYDDLRSGLEMVRTCDVRIGNGLKCGGGLRPVALLVLRITLL